MSTDERQVPSHDYETDGTTKGVCTLCGEEPHGHEVPGRVPAVEDNLCGHTEVYKGVCTTCEERATTPDYPPSYDRIYPRCPVCHREQYSLAVLAFSRGEIGCNGCQRFIREEARLHDDRCTCQPCNPKPCDQKCPTRAAWCDLDEGHDGPHNDYEEMFQWTT